MKSVKTNKKENENKTSIQSENSNNPVHQHKQVKVYDPVYKEFREIDRGIVNLIKRLWDMDIAIDECCEKNKKGKIFIKFSTVFDAEKFLTIVATVRDKKIKNLDQDLYYVALIDDELMEWEYKAYPFDLSIHFDKKGELYFKGKSKILLAISVEFPIIDYNDVLRLFKQKKNIQKK